MGEVLSVIVVIVMAYAALRLVVWYLRGPSHLDVGDRDHTIPRTSTSRRTDLGTGGSRIRHARRSSDGGYWAGTVGDMGGGHSSGGNCGDGSSHGGGSSCGGGGGCGGGGC